MRFKIEREHVTEEQIVAGLEQLRSEINRRLDKHGSGVLLAPMKSLVQ